MKKTVIKRRKRVPAAASASFSTNTMSDQAAAEALVAVGRPPPEGSQPPKRKRARKSKEGPEGDGGLPSLSKALLSGPGVSGEEGETKGDAVVLPPMRKTSTPSRHFPTTSYHPLPSHSPSHSSPSQAPSLNELERIYRDFGDERRRLEGLLDRVDVVMKDVWKGIEHRREEAEEARPSSRAYAGNPYSSSTTPHHAIPSHLSQSQHFASSSPAHPASSPAHHLPSLHHVPSPSHAFHAFHLTSPSPHTSSSSSAHPLPSPLSHALPRSEDRKRKQSRSRERASVWEIQNHQHQHQQEGDA
jgi:hypothetical protein